MADRSETERDSWKPDKRTLELVVALGVHAVLAAWYLSGYLHQVTTNTETIKDVSQRADLNGEWRQMQAVMDTKIQALNMQLGECKTFHARLENKLDSVLFARQSRAEG